MNHPHDNTAGGTPNADAQSVARRAAISIVRRLREHGHVAYLAGGCVRDELLGLNPTDYDVATDAPPQRVTSIFPRTAEVGASFGVVLVRQDSATVEVATFRSDGPYSDRRRPDTVKFSDPASDAKRRDFTINALFLDPLDEHGVEQSPGRVIDFVGGQADLKARVLRAVGDPAARLDEDHLRALRAVRFSARLGFAIEPATADAIRRHAGRLAGVSRERIGDEVRRMLADRCRARAVKLLQTLGLDAPVLNDAASDAEPAHVAALQPNERVSFALGLAAWALDRGLQPAPREGTGTKKRSPSAATGLVGRWRAALCLSNDEAGELNRVLSVLGTLTHAWDDLGVAGRKRLAAGAAFAGAVTLLKHRDGPRATRVEGEVAELRSSLGGLAPEPLLTGDRLIAAGLVAGPSFRAILERVYDAQLEGRVKTHAEALQLGLEHEVKPDP